MPVCVSLLIDDDIVSVVEWTALLPDSTSKEQVLSVTYDLLVKSVNCKAM